MYSWLFAAAGFATPFWLLMIFLPGWRVTKYLADRQVFPVLLALLYTVGVGTAVVQGGLGFVRDFGSEEGVIRLLAAPEFALIVWIHILCFDQAIGHRIYRENMEHRVVPLPVQSILLFLTLMFGPFGWLLYTGLRALRRRTA
ncbi:MULTISPECIES: ABA4-like family protein [Paenibacillus]|uniref:ABA4-like family protein n=1 Tax=Paenibacillus TaxID=44249 RepID=UPI0022B8A595|nr:ABA4-like family protein [Paenibacillus caseinilyticus]MCZ8521242.1 ABA4-like family protein [Paenibacillus caseinilyticus]